jgi:hypothetical protein
MFAASTPRLDVRLHAQMPQLERAKKGFAIQAVHEIGQRFVVRGLVTPWRGRGCRTALGFLVHSVPLFFWRPIIATVRNGHNRTDARSCYGAVTSIRTSLTARRLWQFVLATQLGSIEWKPLVAHARVRESHGQKFANVGFVDLTHVECVNAEARNVVALG